MSLQQTVLVIARFRWLVLGVMLLVTALVGAGALGVGVDNSLEIWFVQGDPSLKAYEDFQEDFGNDEVVVLAVHRPDGVLTQTGMDAVFRVGEAAAGVAGIDQVTSLATVRGMDGEEGFIDIRDLYVAGQPVDEAKLRKRVLGNPVFRGGLVSEDGTTALVVARMAPADNIDAVRDPILAELKTAVDAVDVADARPVRTAGIGVIYAALNRLSMVDSGVFIGGCYLMIVLVLMWQLRRAWAVALIMSVVGISATLVMGLYGWAGRDINMVTMVLPTLVLIIGVSDCVHLMHHAAALPPLEGESRMERVSRSMAFMFWPCLFNSLTTAAGFASLAAAPMAVIRDLGLFAAAGVLLAFVVAWVGCAIGLSFVSVEPPVTEGGVVERWVDRLAAFATRRPLEVLGGALAVTLVSALGITNLVVDTYSIGFLYDSHPVAADSRAIEAEFGNYTPLEFVVTSSDPMHQRDVLVAVADWQDEMEATDGVGWTRSTVDFLRRFEQLMADGDPDAYQVPDADDKLEQLYLAYEPDAELGLPRMLSHDETKLRVTAGIPMGSARDFGRAIDELIALVDLPEGATVHASGYLPLYVRMMGSVVDSQLSSFGLAFCVIFVMFLLLFRRIGLASLAIPANLVPVMVVLGVMGAVGIPLDVATVTISAVVLGLVVDDTTQVLYRFREELKITPDDHAGAVRRAVRGAGNALATTTLVLSLGFMVLGLATVKSIAFFGLLCALAMVVALLADLLMLPALLVLLRPDP